MDNSAIQEAIRRRMGQQPSTAGMAGANRNPMSKSPQAVQRPSGASGSSPLMMNQLQKSQPDEALTIVKALVQRLKDLTPQQEQ